MSATELRSLPAEDAAQLLGICETVLACSSLEEFAERALPQVNAMMSSSAGFLYIAGSGLLAPRFFQYGLQPDDVSEIRNRCAEQFGQISAQPALQWFSISTAPPSE